MSTSILWCALFGICFISVHGLKCFLCGHNQNIIRCLHQKECPGEEVCKTIVYLDNDHNPVYHFGCATINECTKMYHRPHAGATTHLSKRFLDIQHRVCSGCCNESDGCNHHLCTTGLQTEHLDASGSREPVSVEPCGSVSVCDPDWSASTTSTVHSGRKQFIPNTSRKTTLRTTVRHNHHPHNEVHTKETSTTTTKRTTPTTTLHHHQEETTTTTRTTPTASTRQSTTTTIKPSTSTGSLYTANFFHGQPCVDHEDESLSCANLAAHGYCTPITNMEYVYQVAKERCRKTCGFC